LKAYGALRYEKWGKAYLDGVAKSFSKDGIAAKSVVLRGAPADVILDYVRDNAFDWVIMSTPGRTGPAKWTIGSVTDRVLRQSVSPVMVVRPQECQVTI
jgi:nucleotide-binding universal stress UspA family protein